jgi:hypothetical protein
MFATASPLDRTDPLTLSEEYELVRVNEERSDAFLRRAEAEREARAQQARMQRQKPGADIAYEI